MSGTPPVSLSGERFMTCIVEGTPDPGRSALNRDQRQSNASAVMQDGTTLVGLGRFAKLRPVNSPKPKAWNDTVFAVESYSAMDGMQ